MVAVKGTVKDTQRKLTQRLLFSTFVTTCVEKGLGYFPVTTWLVLLCLCTCTLGIKPRAPHVLGKLYQPRLCYNLDNPFSSTISARRAHFLQLLFGFSCQMKTWTHGGSAQRSWTGTPHSTAILVLTAPPALSTERYKGYLMTIQNSRKITVMK